MATDLPIVFRDSDDEDFDGFTESDIDNSVGDSSDISLSEDSEVSESDSDDEIDTEPIQIWTDDLTPFPVRDFEGDPGASFILGSDNKEIDFFYKFFPQALVNKIVEETNAYAEKCIEAKPDRHWSATNAQEMMAFLGIYVVLSIICLPSYTLAWKTVWPFEVPSIPSIMTRSRFEKLNKYFHFNDRSNNPPRGQPGHDKLCHIRPVLDVVGEKCLSNYKPPKEQSVDEGMIAFKGRLSFKQYLPAKPTKFGVKVWERASPKNGYVHEFQIYTGRTEQNRTEEGLGARVVKDLTRNITGKNHVVYMDNFFASPELFESLLKEKVYCCGTVRLNRKGMPEAIKQAKLKKRGENLVMQKGELVATAWKDKKIVTYLSTNCDPTEKTHVQRRKKDGSMENVAARQVTDLYNKFMFGVDLADQKRMQYSTCRKAKKWYKYLFWFCFDLAVVNSHICMQESPNHQLLTKGGKHKKITQLDYRMALAQQMIGQYRGLRKRKAPAVIGNCGMAHWPIHFEKAARCKQCIKEKRRREVLTGCQQCNVRLCIKNNCFVKFHEELLK